jgi:preprotein translocase subunit SecG
LAFSWRSWRLGGFVRQPNLDVFTPVATRAQVAFAVRRWYNLWVIGNFAQFIKPLVRSISRVRIEDALNIIQLVLAIVLTAVVLMQTKGSTMSGLFGGGDSSSVYRTRRGFERTLFQFTIVLAVVFFLIALVNSVIT